MKNKLTIILIILVLVSILLNVFFRNSKEEKIVIITEEGTEVVKETDKNISDAESATLFVSSITGTTAILQLVSTSLSLSKVSNKKTKKRTKK